MTIKNDCENCDTVIEQSSVFDDEGDKLDNTDFVESLDVNFSNDFDFNGATLNDLDTSEVKFDDNHLFEDNNDENSDRSI